MRKEKIWYDFFDTNFLIIFCDFVFFVIFCERNKGYLIVLLDFAIFCWGKLVISFFVKGYLEVILTVKLKKDLLEFSFLLSSSGRWLLVENSYKEKEIRKDFFFWYKSLSVEVFFGKVLELINSRLWGFFFNTNKYYLLKT